MLELRLLLLMLEPGDGAETAAFDAGASARAEAYAFDAGTGTGSQCQYFVYSRAQTEPAALEAGNGI